MRGRAFQQSDKIRSSWRTRLRVFGLRREKEYFIENLAMMLASGMTLIPILKSMHSDAQTKHMTVIIQEMTQKVEEGKSF